MPTYSYVCHDCDHTYDALQSMSRDPDTLCPECGGRVDRLIGAGAGIHFKGTGFYVTDYKSKTSTDSAPKVETAAAAASSSSAAAAPSTAAGASSTAPAASSASSGSKGSGNSSASGGSSGSGS